MRRLTRKYLGLVLLGVLLALPSLRAGFFADDYVQIAHLEGWTATHPSVLDLYSFIPSDRALTADLRARDALPYFAAADLKLAFLRPASSLLMALDHRLWGRSPLPYHVHTLLWYAAMLVAAAVVLRRTAPAGLATLALLIICIDDAHALSVTFVAARNGPVSCALAWFGLAAHVRWRSDGWRGGALLAPLLAAAGLAGGEMGLAALAYLIAWELSARRPGRWRALAPTAAVIAGYLIVYRLTGSGAHASGAYLDPFGAPLTFLRALPARALLLLGNLFVGAPIDFLPFDARLRPALIGLGVVVGIGVGLWLRRALRRMPPDEAATVRWMGLGAAGALFVGTPGFIGERLLLAAGMGGAVVIAALLRDAWSFRRARRHRLLAGVGLVALGLPNLVIAPLALTGKTLAFGSMFAGYRRLALEAEIDAPVPTRAVVVAFDDLFPMYLSLMRAFEQDRTPAELRALLEPRPSGPLPDRLGLRGTALLSMAPGPHRLRRTAADTLELAAIEGTLFDGGWIETMRAPSDPLPRGSQLRTNDMTITVVEDRDGRPTRVAFRFDRALDDPSLVFLAPASNRLRRLTLPPVGEEITIPRRAALPF